MSGQFSITTYGQNPIVMDWNGLSDPFSQFLPINITNNWSGSLYFVGSLVNPPAWYSGTAWSGVALSGSLAGAVPLVSTNNDVYAMTWTINISGNSIKTSSPNTDTLTLLVTAYASGFFSGIVASAILTFSNLLYDRYSGVIKMIGETYNNDQPTITFTQVAGVGFASGQQMSYACSYMLSGWESDLGAAYNTTIISGSIKLDWAAASEAVTQYYVWRWSGTTDLPALSFLSGNPNSNTIDLVGIVSGTTFTDSNGAVLQAGFYRNRNWLAMGNVAQTAHVISPPFSIATTNTTTSFAKQLFLNRNISGTTLIGPWYFIFHLNPQTVVGNTNALNGMLFQKNSPNASASGTIIVPTGLAYSRVPFASWTRFGFYLSGSAINSSGYVWIQAKSTGGNFGNISLYLDDTFVVANS